MCFQLCLRLGFWKMKTKISIHSLLPYMPCLSLAPKTAVPPRFCYKIIKKNKNWRNESLLSPNNKTKQQRFLANYIKKTSKITPTQHGGDTLKVGDTLKAPK